MQPSDKPQLTVFTPTYNRAYILPRCYASMCRQTCQDFIWLVIDDGSADETLALLAQWQQEPHGFRLEYIHQENQGMHGAHNTAYGNIRTELNTCIDSDDYMPDDAVENILQFWNEAPRDPKLAGFLALDCYGTGELVGTPFPQTVTKARYYDYYHTFGVTGDKKFILRSELSRLYPYPRFPQERYVGLALKYYQLDLDYELLCLNKPVCVVEYLPDGSSRNMLRQYWRNPRGFLHFRFTLLRLPYAGLRFKLRQALHILPESLMYLLRFFGRAR
ncbi:MAG: glycosyltransferase family 2 protein [Oscillospiraceae bacterium]|jgi:glycosyltransferase involved in cell wall biosynthesis|nr:glycosyltransferase family 2 protein [Oscillospiraceae bacterium]